MLGTYLGGIVLDYMIFGSMSTKRIYIISKDKYPEIIDYIITNLHCICARYNAYETNTNHVYNEINVIVTKNEYTKLVNYVSKTDPDAFVSVITVNELMYTSQTFNKF